MRHLDLFSGIGGFALAARWAGIETIGFCEIDSFCQQVLQKHWPGVPIYADIKKLNFTDKVGLLTGGFPCQPFSVAGKKKGIMDDRHLWPEMFRVIREVKPDWIIAENVPGIVALALDNILDDLESEGYKTQTFIIPACAANAPHRRDRIWIIANRISERCNNGINNRKTRHLQENLNGYMEEIQSKWKQFIPNAWKVMQSRDWIEFNADLMRKNDGLSNRVDRIKALGNAIVPQVAYAFMKMIQEIEDLD